MGLRERACAARGDEKRAEAESRQAYRNRQFTTRQEVHKAAIEKVLRVKDAPLSFTRATQDLEASILDNVNVVVHYARIDGLEFRVRRSKGHQVGGYTIHYEWEDGHVTVTGTPPDDKGHVRKFYAGTIPMRPYPGSGRVKSVDWHVMVELNTFGEWAPITNLEHLGRVLEEHGAC